MHAATCPSRLASLDKLPRHTLLTAPGYHKLPSLVPANPHALKPKPVLNTQLMASVRARFRYEIFPQIMMLYICDELPVPTIPAVVMSGQNTLYCPISLRTNFLKILGKFHDTVCQIQILNLALAQPTRLSLMMIPIARLPLYPFCATRERNIPHPKPPNQPSYHSNKNVPKQGFADVTVAINSLRPAQLMIWAEVLAVGPEKSDRLCICQASFEKHCNARSIV